MQYLIILHRSLNQLTTAGNSGDTVPGTLRN
jgi:hypothetical protein